jgi:hypothetical protein
MNTFIFAYGVIYRVRLQTSVGSRSIALEGNAAKIVLGDSLCITFSVSI